MIGKTIGFLRAFARLHNDCFRALTDALHDNHAYLQTILTDVIDFLGCFHRALLRVVHDDFIAFLHSLKRVLAPLGSGFGAMPDGFADEAKRVLGSLSGLHDHRFCTLVDRLHRGDDRGRHILGGKMQSQQPTPILWRNPNIGA